MAAVAAAKPTLANGSARLQTPMILAAAISSSAARLPADRFAGNREVYLVELTCTVNDSAAELSHLYLVAVATFAMADAV